MMPTNERILDLEFQRNRSVLIPALEPTRIQRTGECAIEHRDHAPVDIEHLARVIELRDGNAYPDVCLATDSHTTMVDALGVLGGGIEAEAVMLGEPYTMLVPPFPNTLSAVTLVLASAVSLTPLRHRWTARSDKVVDWSTTSL